LSLAEKRRQEAFTSAMPYPESCPECGSQFRNTGTHFTARRNEVGRHVLLELGCQNTSRRFWWDFTTGQPTDDGRASPVRRIPDQVVELVAAGAPSNGAHHPIAEANGHLSMPALTLPDLAVPTDEPMLPTTIEPLHEAAEQPTAPAPSTLKDAFVRQLQLDRLTLRQMRSLLMSEEARRAIEVAVGATEATYERLALILFGADLPQLLGKPVAAAAAPSMSAEERLELQREKARIRARLRRATIKAAKLADAP
jgi:hypothetical protein